ncbi:MAG: hypothetical protein ACKV2Q_14405 [Planctomycetaceae bacterium]
MKCFEHHQSEAIGICVSCGRGLCERCHRLTKAGDLICGENCERRSARRDLPQELFAEEMMAKSHEHRLYAQLFVWLSCLFALVGGVELAGLCLVWAKFNFNRLGIPIWWLGNFDVRVAVLAGLTGVITAVAGRRCRTLANRFTEKAIRFHASDKQTND